MLPAQTARSIYFVNHIVLIHDAFTRFSIQRM